MSGLQVGQPNGVLDVGIDHVLQLAQRLPHHVDVVDVQEKQLSVLIRILTLVSATFHLNETNGG